MIERFDEAIFIGGMGAVAPMKRSAAATTVEAFSGAGRVEKARRIRAVAARLGRQKALRAPGRGIDGAGCVR